MEQLEQVGAVIVMDVIIVRVIVVMGHAYNLLYAVIILMDAFVVIVLGVQDVVIVVVVTVVVVIVAGATAVDVIVAGVTAVVAIVVDVTVEILTLELYVNVFVVFALFLTVADLSIVIVSYLFFIFILIF